VTVAFVAVVRMLSPSSAGRSAIDAVSEAIVKADWVETLETLEALPFLDLVRFGLGLWLFMRTKKAQSEERLKCSSLHN
jgi:hypothetical protein